MNKKYLVWILIMIFAMGVASCQADIETSGAVTETQPSSEPIPTGPGAVFTTQAGAPDETALPSSEPATPDPATIQIAWQSSPHADTYILDATGQNNSCARCHAPINWMPTLEDLPESCFACKFELEAPPATIAQADWTNVPCKICHKVDKKDNILPEVAWLEIAPLGEYSAVASTSELCLKCHAAADITGHFTIEVAGAHAGYECTQCHSAHDTQASCDTPGCHKEPTIPVAGHDADHQAVSCVACHDGSGLEVGLDGETSQWVTFATFSSDPGNESIPFTSHNVIKEASCQRCHYTNNPFGLSENVEIP